MTLLSRIKELCSEKSITLASLEKTLTFGNGSLSRWDSSSPSADKLQKVAEYFNVSTDYLLGDERNIHNSVLPKIHSLGRAQDNEFTEEENEQLSDFISYLMDKRKRKK